MKGNTIASHASSAPNQKGEEKLVKIKTSFKLTPTGFYFDGYFQFVHHSGSGETISPIDRLLATDFRQRNGEAKAAVNFHRTITYGINYIHEKRNTMSN